MKLQGLIFDFDGVIADTEYVHYQAFQSLLVPLNKGFSWELYQEVFIGFDDRDAFTHAYERHHESIDDTTLQMLIEQKARLFQQMVEKGDASLLPGVSDLILASTDCFPIGICSGALRSDIVPILEQNNLLNAFSFIITAEDVTKSKPDPEGYLRAKEWYPSNYKLAVIEDTPAGIKAAKQAGLPVLGVANSVDIDYLNEADRVVDSLSGLTVNTLDKMFYEKNKVD